MITQSPTQNLIVKIQLADAITLIATRATSPIKVWVPSQLTATEIDPLAHF